MMRPPRTTYGSDPQAMAKMLAMGAEADPGDLTPQEAKEDLLARRLRGPLPLTQEQAAELAAVVGELRERLPQHGRALGEVLLDEAAELKVLAGIKEHGKAMSQATDSQVQRDVGLTIYFAAIASAVLFHGERITTYSYAALADAFGRLVDKRWMAPTLARHFAKARRACKRNAD
jgi:hypothetical protein